ncbi:MAG: hypothetical protein Q4E18_13705 [Clostridia bacterium]|nr:hypothetical protein [Clostridia bacterium]
MKNRLRTLTVVLYPYAYLVCLGAYYFLCARFEGADGLRTGGLRVLVVLAVLFNLYAAFSVIANLVAAVRGKRTAGELAKANRMIKLAHIPAYVFHFALGILGLVASVWGIGLILWAILIDFLTIILSGTVGLSASLCAWREGLLTEGESIAYAVLSFVYCADVVAALVFCGKLKKR